MELSNERETVTGEEGIHFPVAEERLTFRRWWQEHKNGECHCLPSCTYKIFMQQESWIEAKAKKRLLEFLKIDENGPYDDGRK